MAIRGQFISKATKGLLAIIPLAVLLSWGGYLVYVYRTNDWSLLVEAVDNHPILLSLFNLLLTGIPLVSLVYYLIHTSRNSDLADRRVAWILLMIFLTPVVLPIYWYLFILHDSIYAPEAQ